MPPKISPSGKANVNSMSKVKIEIKFIDCNDHTVLYAIADIKIKHILNTYILIPMLEILLMGALKKISLQDFECFF